MQLAMAGLPWMHWTEPNLPAATTVRLAGAGDTRHVVNPSRGGKPTVPVATTPLPRSAEGPDGTGQGGTIFSQVAEVAGGTPGGLPAEPAATPATRGRLKPVGGWGRRPQGDAPGELTWASLHAVGGVGLDQARRDVPRPPE